MYDKSQVTDYIIRTAGLDTLWFVMLVILS